MHTTDELTAIDLFSGCGGLSLGLKRAGFRILLALDSDVLATETYLRNNPSTLVLQKDISRISTRSVMKRLGLRRGQLDLLAGCPPCQGFSALRTLNGSHRPKEPLNDLIFQFLRFVRGLLPKTIMLENVPDLEKDWRFAKICRELTTLGYNWTYQVLDAADYGVPQRRRRLILLGSRRRILELATKSRKKLTVRDAIAYLPRPGSSGDPLHDHRAQRSARVMSVIRRIRIDGGCRRELSKRHQLKCHRKTDGFRDVYGRMWWDKAAPTITGGCINPSKGRFLHPSQLRAITLREAALLQGFPRRYFFSMECGTYPTAQMIGNAFPPKFAAVHARKLAEALVGGR